MIENEVYSAILLNLSSKIHREVSKETTTEKGVLYILLNDGTTSFLFF